MDFEDRNESKTRGWVWSVVLPLLYFGGMTLLMTWPLALHLRDSVVGQIGDNVYFVWMMAWFKHAIFDLHVSPINVPQLNYPEGWSLAYTEIAPSELALGFPVSLIWGPVLGYNVALLLTFVLSGYFMHIWVHDLTGNWGAGLLAGTIFAFLPFRMAHFLAGHLNVAGTMWFPIFFMGLSDLFFGSNHRRGVWLSGIGLGLIALTTMYYLYMTILVVGLAALVYFLAFNRRGLLDRELWKGMVHAGLIAAPFVILGLLPFVTLASQGGFPGRSVDSVVTGSASLSDFFLPSTDHFVWGRWITQTFDRDHWIEGTLYLGAVALPLSVLGAYRLKDDRRYRDMLLLLTLVSAIAFCLALGTNLYWLEQMVRVPVPGLLQGIVHRESISIRLPGYYMFLYFPLYSRLRTFKRFAIFVLMTVSLMAGLGASWMASRVKSSFRRPMTLALLVLVFLDFYPGPYTEFAKIEARPVDTWLAAQPGQGVVAQFPFYQEEDQDQVYNTLIHGKPFLGGFFNAFPPPQYVRIKPVMNGFPDQASVDLLSQLDVEYVIVDSSAYEDFPSIEAEIDRLGLPPLATFGTDYVYTLPSP